MSLYQLVIVHSGEPDWANEVERLIEDACSLVLQHDSPVVRLANVAEARKTGAPTAVVILGTPAAASSSEVAAELEAARDEAIPVLPVVRPGAHIGIVLPPSVLRLNALAWDGGSEPVMAALRFLGIIETDRRLFLSYRRAETNALAIQLRRSLSERAYDVFLDRFSVPPGADFQRRINIELSDKAFLLVLESESAIGSDWVQHEVVYALSHLIGILALTMPGTQTEEQFEVVDDAFRLHLATADFEGSEPRDGLLTDEALRRVLGEVEFRYAREMRRRRLQMLAATGDFLREAGYDRSPLDEWAYLASRNSDRIVVSVTPMAPSPRDLRHADVLRQRVESEMGMGTVPAYLVHDALDRDPDGQALAEWIVAGRPLYMTAIAELPGLLT